MLPLIIVLTIAFPIAWLLSEFQPRRWLRILLGCAAIAMSFLVATGVGALERLNSNAWYGFASKELVDSTLDELQSGNTNGVVTNLTWLQAKFQPTYENRARYDELVAEYVDRFGDPGL